MISIPFGFIFRGRAVKSSREYAIRLTDWPSQKKKDPSWYSLRHHLRRIISFQEILTPKNWYLNKYSTIYKKLTLLECPRLKITLTWCDIERSILYLAKAFMSFISFRQTHLEDLSTAEGRFAWRESKGTNSSTQFRRGLYTRYTNLLWKVGYIFSNL